MLCEQIAEELIETENKSSDDSLRRFSIIGAIKILVQIYVI